MPPPAVKTPPPVETPVKPLDIAEAHKEAMFDIAFRLRRAVCSISEKRPTHERAIIDQFLRHISPSMARNRGVDFPRTCRSHPRCENRTPVSAKSSVMYFHIGNAIFGFYNMVANEPDALMSAETRVKVLEAIAKYGVDHFFVDGSDSEGYQYQPLPPLKIEGFNELPTTSTEGSK